MTVFETLNAINVNGHTEKKNGLTYLSWAWAWAELLKHYPDSTYQVYENKDGWCYHTDGRTAWVKTGVTVEGKEYIEMLPVMDFKNRSIPLDTITSMDVNKAIQRSLTKAVARHGLGLYIYAGEDLPEAETSKALDEAQNDIPADAVKPGTRVALPKSGEFNARQAISVWCIEHNMNMQDFGAVRKALISAGLVEDVPSQKLSREQLDKLLELVEQNRSGS